MAQTSKAGSTDPGKNPDAAVPLIKVLTNQALPVAVRAVGEILEGAAKPIGSDAEGVVRLEGPPKTRKHHG